jgi:hypothetical protein
MLATVGPRLQRLQIRTWERWPARSQDSLVPAVLKHCPVLAHLELTDIWPVNSVVV